MPVIYKCTKCGKIHEKGYKCHVRSKHSNNSRKPIQTTRWRKLREYIIGRDNCMCMRCLHKHNVVNSNDLTVHHIKSRHYYPELTYEESNLITICRSCNSSLGDKKPLDFKWEPKERVYTL